MEKKIEEDEVLRKLTSQQVRDMCIERIRKVLPGFIGGISKNDSSKNESSEKEKTSKRDSSSFDFSNVHDMMSVASHSFKKMKKRLEIDVSEMGESSKNIGCNDNSMQKKIQPPFWTFDDLTSMIFEETLTTKIIIIPTWSYRLNILNGEDPQKPIWKKIVRFPGANPIVGGQDCDMIIMIPAKFTKNGEERKIMVHSWVLRWSSIKKNNVWDIPSSHPFDKIIEMRESIIDQAIKFCYEGSIGEKNSGDHYYHFEDCGPLLLFSVSIGFEELRDHIYENFYFPSPSENPSSTTSRSWMERINFFTVRCIEFEKRNVKMEDFHSEVIFDVEMYCEEYHQASSMNMIAEREYLLSCLRRVPLFVVESLLFSIKKVSKDQERRKNFHTIDSGLFLEIWSTANYENLTTNQVEGKDHHSDSITAINDDIINLVSSLQLPVDYLRDMLEVGSNLVSVCAGTPKGEAFLQSKFKYLQICDESVGINGVSYCIDSRNIQKFEFTGLPSESSVCDRWPSPSKLIAGRSCVMVCLESFARLAFGSFLTTHNSKNRGDMIRKKPKKGVDLNFSDLNIWGYGPDAYIIPVWGLPLVVSGDDDSNLDDISYVVIRDDPMETIARLSFDDSTEEKKEDHFGNSFEATHREKSSYDCLDLQVCMLISGETISMMSAEVEKKKKNNSNVSRVVDLWHVPNSQEFSPQMTWDGFYVKENCLIGWAPDDSWSYCGTCCSGTRGSFYILKCGKEMMNRDPIIIKSGVSLSNVGCYCLIEGSCGVPWIVYVELSGKIMYLELLCGMKDSARKTSNSFHPTLPDYYDEEEKTTTKKKVFAVVEERVPPNSLSMCSSPENGQVAILYDNFVNIYSVVKHDESMENNTPGLAFCYKISLSFVDIRNPKSKKNTRREEEDFHDKMKKINKKSSHRRMENFKKIHLKSSFYKKKKVYESSSSSEEEEDFIIQEKERKCVSISICQSTLDIYVIDEDCIVHCLPRIEQDKEENLDKFFEGDDTTVQLNPALGRKWSNLMESIKNKEDSSSYSNSDDRNSSTSQSPLVAFYASKSFLTIPTSPPSH